MAEVCVSGSTSLKQYPTYEIIAVPCLTTYHNITRDRGFQGNKSGEIISHNTIRHHLESESRCIKFLYDLVYYRYTSRRPAAIVQHNQVGIIEEAAYVHSRPDAPPSQRHTNTSSSEIQGQAMG